jgi:hypothetical protein
VTRRERLVIAAGAAAVLVVLISRPVTYAAVRAAQGWPWMATAAGMAAAAFAGFRAGQYARGAAHARGIWRSHRAAIRGGHR